MTELNTSMSRQRLASFTAMKALPQKVGVAKVMGNLLDADLTAGERFAAEAIVQDLCVDTIEAVRVALARSVAASPTLPRALAERLATDIEDVSIPILQLSPMVSDEILKAVVASGSTRQVEATAERSGVSDGVSAAIIERRHLPAVSKLVRNRSANMTAETWEAAIDRYGDNEEFAQAAKARGGIPEPVAAKITQAAKAHVSSFIVRYLNVPETSIPSLEKIDVEAANRRLLPKVVPDNIEARKYAAILKKHGRLDRAIVLKALCSGEFDFLVHALAQIASVSFEYVQRNLFAAEPDVVAEFLRKAGIDERLIPVFRALLSERDGADLGEYQRSAVARVAKVMDTGRGARGASTQKSAQKPAEGSGAKAGAKSPDDRQPSGTIVNERRQPAFGDDDSLPSQLRSR